MGTEVAEGDGEDLFGRLAGAHHLGDRREAAGPRVQLVDDFASGPRERLNAHPPRGEDAEVRPHEDPQRHHRGHLLGCDKVRRQVLGNLAGYQRRASMIRGSQAEVAGDVQHAIPADQASDVQLPRLGVGKIGVGVDGVGQQEA